jgi:hypothetical protein
MSGKSTGKRGRPAKKGRLGLNRRQRLESELRKAVAAEAVAAEAKEGALGADAIGAASADAFRARERAAVARARLTAASAPSERHAASGHLGNEAQINGTVKRVKPSWDDEEAHREAKLELTLEQVALQEMRAQGRGWVCALWVGERLHVYLAGDLAGDNRWIRKVVAIASSPEAAAALARAEAADATAQAEAASSTAGGDAAPEAEAEAASTPEPSAQLEAPGASTETDAAAAAAPAACAPEGSTGGAATRPRDHEDESPNKISLKKPLVEHGDTAQHLTFIDAAAAAPAAAAAAAPAAAE